MNRIVFISSTYEDLKGYRRKAWEVLRKFAADVRGMEEFGARKEAPLDTCLAEVAQCDIFVAIIGFRLGSVDTHSGKSFTQLEYEKAYELKKDIRIYLMDESDAAIAPRFVDVGDGHARLEDFKRLLKDRHTFNPFASVDDLGKKLEKDLGQLLTSREPESGPSGDEFDEAAEVIGKFLLVPREYSGYQVRVVLKILGPPFPASRQVCDAFQLAFGKTVGTRVLIANPKRFGDSGLDELFARGEDVGQLMVPVNSSLDVYAALQFSDKRIDRTAARFKSGSTLTMLTPLPEYAGMESTYHEADSKVALLFSRVAGTAHHGGSR